MTIKLTFLRSKVAQRGFVLFIFCALVPITILAIHSFTNVRKQLHEQSQSRLHQASKAMGTILFERLLFLEAEMKMVSSAFQSEAEMIMKEANASYAQRLQKRFNALILVTPAGNSSPIFGQLQSPTIFSKAEEEHLSAGGTLLITRYRPEQPPRI